MAATTRHSTLRIVLPVVAAAEAVMALRNLVVLSAAARFVLPALQMVLVAAILAAWVSLHYRQPSELQLNNVAFALLTWLGLLIPLEQVLTDNGMLAANLALVFAAAGALLTIRSRFVLLLAILTAAWSVAVVVAPESGVAVVDQAIYILLGVLVGAVVNVLRVSDREALQQARDEALRSAMRDELTGLWNRRGLAAVFESMQGGAHEMGTGVWCLFIDVRGLKAVNDSSGHREGDRLLQSVGAAMLSSKRFGGVPVRWGGDEFCIVGVGPEPDIREAYLDLMDAVGRRFERSATWDLSVGSAGQPAEDVELSALIAAADADMYRRRQDVTSASPSDTPAARPQRRSGH